MGAWKNSIGVITRLKRGHASDRYAAVARALASLPCATDGSHLARVVEIQRVIDRNLILHRLRDLLAGAENE